MKRALIAFLLCCALPITADAAGLFNFNDSFDIAKAVKLGRGKAYSVSTSSNLNPGGQISDKKSCSTGCTSCDTSTGTCSGCSGGYYLSGGTCVACSTIPVSNGTCTYCLGDEDYVSCEGAKCNTGYFDDYGSCESCSYTIDNCAECDSTGSTCTKCNSGYTLANNKCFASNACSSIPDYNCYTIDPNSYVGWLGEIGVELCANILSGYGTMQNFALTDPTGSVSENGNCSPTCSAGEYLGSNPATCISCSSGTYSLGGTATSCSSCSNLFVGSNGSMKFTCLSCSTTGTCLTCGYNGSSSGYEMSNGRCEFIGSNSGSSGSTCNSGGATAASPTNCRQGYGWGGSGCVTSSSQCKVCAQGSSLGGYCNCPSGTKSNGSGGCS